MPKIVELPGNREVEFPDDFTEARMSEEILKAFPDLAPPSRPLMEPNPNPYNPYKGFKPYEATPEEVEAMWTPPKAVADAVDSLIPQFKPESPAMAQFIQQTGLEPTRQVAETVSEKIRGAVKSVLSPGGVGLAVAAPMAPGLVGATLAVTAAPGVAQGVKEMASARTGAEFSSGFMDTILSGAVVAGGGLAVAKAGLARAKAPITAEALEQTATKIKRPEASPAPSETPKIEPVRSEVGQVDNTTAHPTLIDSSGNRKPLFHGKGAAFADPEFKINPNTMTTLSGLGPGWFTTTRGQAERFAVGGNMMTPEAINLKRPLVLEGNPDSIARAGKIREMQEISLNWVERVSNAHSPENRVKWKQDYPEIRAFLEEAGITKTKSGDPLSKFSWADPYPILETLRRETERQFKDKEHPDIDPFVRLQRLEKEARITLSASGVENVEKIPAGEAIRRALEIEGYDGVVLLDTMSDVKRGETGEGFQPSDWVIPFKSEQVISKRNKPAPPVTEQAPVTPAPEAAKASEANVSGAATPEAPPAAISEPKLQSTTKQANSFTPSALTTPASKVMGAVAAPSMSMEGVVTSLQKSLRKTFAVGGHMPKVATELWRKKQHEVASLEHSIKVHNGALEGELAKVFGYNKLQRLGGGSRRIPVAAVKEMDAYLHGDPAAKPPPSVRGVLDTMRAEIDAKTDAIIDIHKMEMVRHPIGSPEYKRIEKFIDLLRGNKGIYVHKSHKFFDAKNLAGKPKSPQSWYGDLPQNVRTTAEDFLMGNSPVPMARDEAQSVLLDWLSDFRTGQNFGQGKVGSKDLSILMRRKVIAPEIRAVLGEWNNPLINYAKSAYKMGDFVARHNFLTEVKRQGMGTFLFEEGVNPPGFNEKIAGDTSKTMSPLNGLRTSEEIAAAFREFDSIKETSAPAHLYYMLNGWTKQMAVVHSMMTQSRNLIGRPLMALWAGHYQLDKLVPSVRTVYADLSLKDSPLVQSLYKHGILGDSARMGEVKAVLKDAALNDVAPADLHSFSIWRAAKKVGLEAPQELYRASDELGNVFGFLNERAIQAEVHPAWSQAEVDAHAAKIVRRLYPFYSETPAFVQAFRKLPTGPFVTFGYQMYRTTWNGLAQSISEIRSTNPTERKVGAKRLASQMVAMTLPFSLQSASKAVFGISQKEEDDFRRTQPFWSKYAQFMFVGVDRSKGEKSILNLSYISPYGLIADPITALSYALRNNMTLPQAAFESAKEALRPWTSEQILLNAVLEATEGHTDTGKEIYAKTDSNLEKLQKGLKHIGMILLPGTVQRFKRRILPAIRNEQPPFSRKLEVGPEIAREVTGVGFEKVSFKNFLAHKAGEFRTMDRDAEAVFHKTLRRTETTTSDDILAAYKEADRRRLGIWREMRKDLLASLRAGVTIDEAKRTLAELGMQKKDISIITMGRYEPMQPSDQANEIAKKRNRVIPKEQIKAYIAESRKVMLDDQ